MVKKKSKFPAIFLPIILLFSAGIIKKISDRERNTLHTETYRIPVKKLQAPLRLVFLSDLHEKEFGFHNEELLRQIERVRPEIVLIGGDSIVMRKSRKNPMHRLQAAVTARLLRALCAKYPVYYALGNHELRYLEEYRQLQGREERRAFLRTATELPILSESLSSHAVPGHPFLRKTVTEEEGEFLQALQCCHVLDEESCILPGHEEICLMGSTLPMCCYQNLLRKPFRELSDGELRKLSGMRENRAACKEYFRISLLHSPFYGKQMLRAGADLVLSGHLHGGAVRIPRIGALMTPQYRFFVSFVSGIKRQGEKSRIISRGLGTHSVNVRLHNLPELSVVELVPA